MGGQGLLAEVARRDLDPGDAQEEGGEGLCEGTVTRRSARQEGTGELRGGAEVTAQSFRQATDQRSHPLVEQARHEPARCRILEQRQRLDRKRERDAIVIRPGREAVVEREALASELDRTRKRIGRGRIHGEQIAKLEFETSSLFCVRIPPPSEEARAVDHPRRQPWLEQGGDFLRRTQGIRPTQAFGNGLGFGESLPLPL